MKNFILLILISTLFSNSILAKPTVKVENLRTEYLRNPIGIDVNKPRFSWQTTADERGRMQSAYQIKVSTDRAGHNTVWTSGKVSSDKSVHIVYDGSPLKASTRYYWQVSAWVGKTKITSEENAFFETGLLDTGWGNAKWIQHPVAEENIGQRETPARFILELDMTLVKDNAGIIFSAKDANNMYMWSINTHDNKEPILRRHIYKDGKPTYSDIMIGLYVSKKNLIGKEHRIKIDVANNIIKTYLNNTLIDKFTNTDENLIDGYIGFRAYSGNNTDEVAYYDNIKLTTFNKGVTGKLQPSVIFTENFEKDENEFEGGETIKVNGNTKLHMFSKSGDTRLLQHSSNGIPMFRTKFNISKTVESARIYSSGMGVYDLFLNGQRVGTQTDDGKVIYDELKPGWTDYSKTVFYSTYDVSNLLKSGTNAIGAIVSSGWFTGDISHGEYGNPALGFLAKLVIRYTDGTTEDIVSDTSWKTSTSNALLLGDIYHGEIYDARKEINWSYADYNDTDWSNATLNTFFKGNITAFVGPPVQVRPELQRQTKSITVYNGNKNNGSDLGAINIVNLTNESGSIALKKGETAIYDMGQNMVGWVKFTVNGQSGTKMKLRFGEMLNDSGQKSKGNDGPAGSIYTANLRSAKAISSYTLKGAGDETYHPSFTFFGFRYCEITATQDITIKSLVGEVIGSVCEEGSSFETSNLSVNQLYSNVIWGQRSNYLSIPTDCPQRDERLGWTGDTQIFVRAAAYNSDIAAFFHKWMGDMRDSQHENGAYPNVAPYTWNVGYGAIAWAEAGLIVPWTIYVTYNDKGILEENYSSMEKYMQFLASKADDQYKYNGANTTYGDWLSYEATDKRYIGVAYYAYAAQLMSKMSQALSQQNGDLYSQNAYKYEDLYNKIKAEFQQRYVNEDGSLKETSQTAYLLALKLDLFPDEITRDKGLNYLIRKIENNGNKLSTGFVGTGILNQTLSQLGADNTAYSLLLQRGNPSWLYSVDQGATTIWERWNSYTIESGFGDVGMNSFNHYAYGAVSEWLYRFVAGIDLDESNPGFKHIILQPTPDTREKLPEDQERISWVKATYNSYYGNIKSEWKIKDDGRITYSTTIPANTTATLHLPLLNIKDQIYEGEKTAKRAKGVKFVEVKNGKAIFLLQSGSYSFDVRQK